MVAGLLNVLLEQLDGLTQNRASFNKDTWCMDREPYPDHRKEEEGISRMTLRRLVGTILCGFM
jgi:hypothetical protein